MLLGARQFFEKRGAPTPSVPTARDYVQSGLVAMWDGIENAGWGVHDASATTWVDLTGNGHDITLNASCCQWDSDALRGASSAASPYFWGQSGDSGGIDAETMESVVDLSGYTYTSSGWAVVACLGQYSAFGGGRRSLFVGLDYGRVCVDMNTGSCIQGPELPVGKIAFSAHYESPYPYVDSLTVNGEATSDKYTTDGANGANIYYPYPRIGGRGSSGGVALSGIAAHCYRLYNRALSASEIAANYAIDKARFNLP